MASQGWIPSNPAPIGTYYATVAFIAENIHLLLLNLVFEKKILSCLINGIITCDLDNFCQVCCTESMVFFFTTVLTLVHLLIYVSESEMTTNGDDLSTADTNLAELRSELGKAQYELNIAQKKNRRMQSELKTWKDRAVQAENRLKQEKRDNEDNIMQLGFKMFQFENQLRKEQREIENKFIEKDSQIKILEDVISSLHSRIKKNSLCYNCFVVKHNAPDHNVGLESYSIKFPLDLDFTDHKTAGHNTHESKNRSISLPLNMQSPHESPKPNSEFCFHHMLSPVPEELENSFLEHAKRVNKEDAIEEEDEDEGERREEGAEEAEEVVLQTSKEALREEENDNQGNLNKETADLELQFGKIESNNHIDSINVGNDMPIGRLDGERDQSEMEEKYDNCCPELGDNILTSPRNNLNEQREASGLEERALDERTNQNEVDRQDQILNTQSSETEEKKIIEEARLEDEKETDDTMFDLKADVNLMVLDLIHQVGQMVGQEKDSIRETVEITEAENTPEFYQKKSEDSVPEEENRIPLSPKSEAIVAELKKAIFEASMELEKKGDLASDGAATGIEGMDTLQLNNACSHNTEISESSCEVGHKTELLECKEDQDKNSSRINIDEIGLETVMDGPLPSMNEAIDKWNEPSIENQRIEHSALDSCPDTLTDYDVIELD